MLRNNRDWVWRGWQVRYTYLISRHHESSHIPVLLIHGFGSSHEQWAKNIAPLSQCHPVYAFDLLGFGASQKASTPYQVNLWVQQTYDFWRTFIGRPVIIIGHSLGALVAATVASQLPQTVDGVVLLTIPATRQERISNPWVQTLLGTIEKSVANPLVIRLIFHLARQPRVIRAALKLSYANTNYVTDALVNEYVRPTYDRGAAQTLCRLTQAATSPTYSQSRETLLANIQQPMLILWGEGDRVIPIQQSHTLRKQFPDITWIDFPNAGHCLYDEYSEQVNDLILNWIQDQDINS